MAAVVTTVDAYYAAVQNTLRTVYDSRIMTYAVFDENALITSEAKLITPALLFQLESLECDDVTRSKDTRGRVTIRLNAALHVVMSSLTVNTQAALDVFASSLLSLLLQYNADTRFSGHGQRWSLGIAVEPVAMAHAAHAEWLLGLSGYAGRTVRYSQNLYVSDQPLVALNES